MPDIEVIRKIIINDYRETKNITIACEGIIDEYPTYDFITYDIGNSYIVEIYSKINKESIDVIEVKK